MSSFPAVRENWNGIPIALISPNSPKAISVVIKSRACACGSSWMRVIDWLSEHLTP